MSNISNTFNIFTIDESNFKYCANCASEPIISNEDLTTVQTQIYSYKLNELSTNSFCVSCIKKSQCYNCVKNVNNLPELKPYKDKLTFINSQCVKDKNYESYYLKEKELVNGMEFSELYFNNRYKVFLCGDCCKICSDEDIFYLEKNKLKDFEYAEIFNINNLPENHNYTIEPYNHKKNNKNFF